MAFREPYCLGIKANWNNSLFLKKKRGSKLKRAAPLYLMEAREASVLRTDADGPAVMVRASPFA